MNERIQSAGEEIANSISHGIGLLAAIAAVPFLIVSTSQLGFANFVGALVFGATMVMLYLTSMLYHVLPHGRVKRVFLKLDYGAIYLFIAGSYTAFALGAIDGMWGWTFLGLVWTLSILGFVLKAIDRLTQPWISTGLYLVLGWLVLVAAVPLFEHIHLLGIKWLLAGGLAYTVGVVFFALSSMIRYAHSVWHVFVLTGTGCHFLAVSRYAG